MATRILIPIKNLSDGKSRLAAVLDTAGRVALGRRLVQQTLATATSIAAVTVVTADPWVQDAATQAGAEVIPEPSPAGLNAALDVARRRWPPSERMLILPIDLPRLRLATLRRLAHSTAGVIVVPDRSGSGTNILVLPENAVAAFRFSYGLDSCRRHSAEAARLGLPSRRLAPGDAALDLDTPRDLVEIPEIRSWLSRR